MMRETTLEQIEMKTGAYAARREQLRLRLAAMQAEFDAIKKRYLREVRRCVALVRETEQDLHAAIAAAPELFERPKTQVFHGIKVGYRKGAGGLDWEDDEDLVRKIERMFPDDDEAARYLIIKKKPSAEALEDLDGATLKRLGVQVLKDGEQVVVKAVESDIEKLVKALLKDAMDHQDDAA